MRMIIRPTDGVVLKGVYGSNRLDFKEGRVVKSSGIVRGIDGEIHLNQLLPALKDKPLDISLGATFVSKFQADDNDLFLTDQGAYLTYVPCIVIRKKLWNKFFRLEKIGTFFAHIDTVCRAKIGHTAHALPSPAIKMRLHMQTWSAKHFEIWNIYFPKIIWELDNYSLQAKENVIQRYPLKSVRRVLASRAYGRFNFKIFKSILLPAENSSLIVKVSGFLISIIPRELFRQLYIYYILIFRNKHTVAFSPKLALSQLQRRK